MNTPSVDLLQGRDVLNDRHVANFSREHATAMRLPMTEDERTRLKQLAREARDVRVRRRARALLDVDEGKSARALSWRYHVARSTIYNWIKRYRTRGLIDEALRDLPRSGRPRMARKPDDQGGGQPGA